MSSTNSATPKPLLLVDNLYKKYGERMVVDNLSFSIARGEILGLLGPNGAGKSTTVGMIYGAIIPDSGTAVLEPKHEPCSSREARRRLGIVTQENNLDPDFSALDNLLLFAHHYRIPKSKALPLARDLLQQVGLSAQSEKRIEQLSGGMQRRLVLARALIPEPELILLDEPTTGFDPEARHEFWKIIRQLRERGTSVLLTTHYMDEAERLCDRLLLLQNGKCVDEGSPRHLISKIVGEDVIEIEGLTQSELFSLLGEDGKKILPLAHGFLLSCRGLPQNTWEKLANTKAQRLTKRTANLEDVFISLTGAGLG